MEDRGRSHCLQTVQSQPTSSLAKKNLILFSNSGNSILHTIFNFYLSFPQHFTLLPLFFSCPSKGFPRKPIHLNACETDRAHHQLTEMMEINNMQFIQINGCDDTELMAGANKRRLQVDNDYCSGEL